MLTPQQIIAALKISSAVTLNNASAPFNTIVQNDITNWAAALGLVPGTDTAKLLIQIVNPLGQNVYQNAGWNTSDFSAPDIQFNINTAGPTETLPVLTGTPTVLSGNYTINIQFSVVQGGNPAVTGSTSFTTNIDADHLLREGKMTGTYACNTSPTTFTATDTTVLTDTLYQYISVTRTLTVTPPAISGQAPSTGNTNALTINNLWAPAPYQYSVVGVVNYTLGADTFAVNYTASGFTDVVCNSIFCQMACWLRKISEQFRREKNTTNQEALIRKWMLGWDDFQMAITAQNCGDTTAYDEAIKWFIHDTKFDPKCNCCENVTAMPVIPSGGVGPPGADGKTAQFQTAGGYVQWKYTTDAGWTNLFQIPAGLPGTPGQNGAPGNNGLNGTAVLYNNFANAATQGHGSFEVVDKFTLPANTLQNVGDEIVVKGAWTTSTYTGSMTGQSQAVRFTFAGNPLLLPYQLEGAAFFIYATTRRLTMEARIVRVSANQIKYTVKWKTQAYSNINDTIHYAEQFVQGYTVDYEQGSSLMNSLNFGAPIEIDSQAYSLATGDITSEYMAVYLNRFGVAALPSVYGTYADDTAAAAAGVPIGGFYIKTSSGAITVRQT